MTFGEKVKERRVRLDLSRRELAERVGVHQNMILRYEKDTASPRTRDGYRRLAEALEVDINYLLTEDQDFVTAATEQYGRRGRRQAQELIDDMAGLFAGGSLSEQDKDAVMKALQDIYWESKARNAEKYTPKKYRAPKD
ncbi:MAG: helix-turn-helix transcriptional regulator [Clostridia bacterium]|nr:helix-turn-helix transcriptional regulator [Clostridia bacterium]